MKKTLAFTLTALFLLASCENVLHDSVKKEAETTTVSPSRPSIYHPADVGPTFPGLFRGTWGRQPPTSYTNTLTFGSKTFRDSGQAHDWVLESISGNTYTIKRLSLRTTITITFVNGSLVIVDHNPGAGSSDWTDTWVK